MDWVMHGNMTFPFNAMGVFMPMDKMIGKDFENGLANLKSVSESASATAPTASVPANEGADSTVVAATAKP